MKAFVIENNWLPRGTIDFGWGNGYVLIPKGHPLHGRHYDDINVDVHGGLTFSELVDDSFLKWANGSVTNDDIGSWCVGFDTVHCSDSLGMWPKDAVEAEAKRPLDQLQSYTEN